jgi:hypothetical protein
MQALCRAVEVEPDDSELRAAVAAVGDWDAAVDLAVGHGVAALAGGGLARLGIALPEPAARRFAEHRRAHRLRGIAASAETVRVLSVLRNGDVPALPLKGPVLASQAYGDTGARDYGDVDVLVARSDLARARATLHADGYVPTVPLTAREERWHARLLDQVVELTRPGSVLPVEVHGRIHPPLFGLPLERDLWRRRAPVGLDGVTVAAMSPEDTLLVVCTHASRDEWRRLESVACVAHLLARHDLDWDVVRRAAAHAGALRMVGVGLCLAHDLLRQAPPRPARWLADDSATKRLAAEIAGRLLTGDPLRGDRQGFNPAMRMLHVRLRERRRDRARYLARLLVLPTLTEVELVTLPRALEPLYALVRLARIARLAPRHLRGAA